MNEFSSCVKCGFLTPLLDVRFCSQCGGRMFGSQKARKLGWVSVVIGMLLVAMMISTVIWLKVSDGEYTGSKEMTVLAITQGIIITAIGVLSIVGGRWQIKYGMRNKTITKIALGLAIAFAIVGVGIIQAQ